MKTKNMKYKYPPLKQVRKDLIKAGYTKKQADDEIKALSSLGGYEN